MNVISVTQDDVAQFAAASADRNPLHVDAGYCRTTPYGRPIVHGALAVLATAAYLDASEAKEDRGLRIIFRQPVFAQATYEVQRHEQAEGCTLQLQRGELTVLSLTSGRFGTPADSDARSAADRATVVNLPIDTDAAPEGARVFKDADLGALGTEEGEYRPDLRQLRELAGRFRFRHSDPWLCCLAWASFWTGMRTPGRDALLCGVRLQRCVSSVQPARDPDRVSYRVRPPRFDRRTGAVGLIAHLAVGNATFRIEVDSMLRRAAPQATPTSVSRYASKNRRLVGATVAVIGGSRGLGRAFSLALAALGATVLVVYRDSAERFVEMQSLLAAESDRLIPVQCDATDSSALEAALSRCPGRLAGLILCAAPAIPALPLNAAATEEMLRFLDSSVRLAWSPLTVCAPRLLDDAFVLFASSTAIDKPPPWWPHYVAAKSAIEGIAQFTAAHRPWKVTIARLPRLWTELSSTATGAIGAASTESMAARLLESVLGERARATGAPSTRRAALLSAEELS